MTTTLHCGWVEIYKRLTEQSDKKDGPCGLADVDQKDYQKVGSILPLAEFSDPLALSEIYHFIQDSDVLPDMAPYDVILVVRPWRNSRVSAIVVPKSCIADFTSTKCDAAFALRDGNYLLPMAAEYCFLMQSDKHES